jgi:hypothetical protein
VRATASTCRKYRAALSAKVNYYDYARRTLSPTLSYEAGVMARLWYWLHWDTRGQLTATTC